MFHGCVMFVRKSGQSKIMQFVIVDTDILIDAGLKIDKAINYLQRLEQENTLGVSVITQMELIIGCRNKRELNSLDKFLRRFEIITINETISFKSVELLRKYRLSHGLLIADALIAATVFIMDVSVLTKNKKDYQFIEGIKMIPYDWKT